MSDQDLVDLIRVLFRRFRR